MKLKVVLGLSICISLGKSIFQHSGDIKGKKPHLRVRQTCVHSLALPLTLYAFGGVTSPLWFYFYRFVMLISISRVMKMKRSNKCENTCVAYFCEIFKECLLGVCLRSRTKKSYKWIYSQNWNEVTNVENKFVVIKGGRGRDKWGDCDWHICTAIYKIDN